MRYLLCLAAIAACLAAASQHARAAAPSGNPCALLTLAQAQSITHFSLQSTDPNPLRADQGQDKDTACSYQNDSDQSVTIKLHDDPAFFPGNAKNPNTEGYRAVKGIGDKALTNAMAMGASVEMLVHGRYASIMVMDPSGLKDRGARNYTLALAVAKAVAKRM